MKLFRVAVVVALFALLFSPLAPGQRQVRATGDEGAGLPAADNGPGTPTHATPTASPTSAVATTPATPTPKTGTPTHPAQPVATPGAASVNAAPPSPSPSPARTPQVATPSASPAASPSPSPSPLPSPSPSPSPTAEPGPDPNAPAGPLAMPGDGLALRAPAGWRTAVTAEALRHQGVPYVWGGASPAGWDCSGFVQWVFRTAAGVDIPRTAGVQAGVGVLVAPDALQPGDLVFFMNTYAPGISHVGISLGGDRYVEAANAGAGTIVSSLSDPYHKAHFAGARRLLTEDPDAGAPVVPVAPENALLPVVTGSHLDVLSPIPLYAPFRAGQTWHAGGEGSFYGRDSHTDAQGAHYAVDFSKGTVQAREASEGQPVLAVADGIVNNVYATLGGGWTVELFHRSPDGTLLRSVYTHLKDDPRESAKLKLNQAVLHGTTIGYVGNSGVAATGTRLYFALYLLKDGAWASIRAEPMEGQALADGAPVVSHNDPAARQEFTQAWGAADTGVASGQQRSWLWGPAPLTSALIEGYQGGQDNARLAQYFDKGRMELRPDGKGNVVVSAGSLGSELLTGKVDLGGGRIADYGPAQIPLVGHMRDKTAPTYADAGMEAASRTLDYRGVPVAWQLTRGGKIVPIAAPAPAYLTDYDPVTGHNNADVFVSWLRANGLADGQAPANDTLNSLAAGDAPATLYAAGHPLSDPFWVVVAVDGQPRTVLVQVFERWTLTYTPGNPAGWQVELGNVGRHYYEWRYEQESLDALLGIANPDEPTRRRRHRGRLLKGKLPGDGGI